MKEYNSKEFILEFFKDCKISDRNGVLTIEEAPKEFEEFIGKKAPYRLVFDFKLHSKFKNSELVTQGSYFLISIKDYLRNRGQTSLLKINIEPDLEEIKLKDFKIIEINPEGYGFLSEFSFLSVYQYLNEKKQVMHKLLITDNEFSELDMTKFKINNGNPEEIPSIALGKSYFSAKKRLHLQTNKEIKTIKRALKLKLEKEIHRVKDHYFKQIKEKDDELERCQEKIKILESKLKHTFYDRDIRILNRLIRESEVRLEMLKKRSYKERLRSEEAFHINDEIEKHVLSIKNVLINTTLYYYPIYRIFGASKGKNISKRYDPVFKKFII
ncbi:MAG: hypothetical protein AABX11_02605 [Nanoarchaeota archaeon]